MQPNFDAKKSSLEKQVERASKILERTHPEQTSDAMADYAAAMAAIRSSDIRVKGIITGLKRLYIYPNREEHNDLLVDLSDLKQLLYDIRVDELLKEKTKEAKKNLGEGPAPRKWPWLLISLVALFILFKPKP